MTELITYLIDTDIILCLVVGYIFVKVYHFVALYQNSKNVEHLIMSSIVVGYVYYKLFQLLPSPINENTLLLIISAMSVSYVLAQFTRSNLVVRLCDFLKIRDTSNVYMWDDLMDNIYPMRVIVHYNDLIYDGIAHNIESYSNSPHIALGSYVIKDTNGNAVKDCSNIFTNVVILSLDNALNVEILYHEKSFHTSDIRNLCEYRNSFQIQKPKK